MDIKDLVGSDAIVPKLKARSKKQVLQELAAKGAALTDVSEQDIFSILLERERLGTTGVGQGVAIPHGKFKGLDCIHGVFARCEEPIDFESVDDQPVDLFFLLLVPEDAGADHLKALARVSRLLRDKDVCEKLRGSDTVDALRALLEEPKLNAA